MFMKTFRPMRSPDGAGGPPAATPQAGIPTTTMTGGMPQPSSAVVQADFPHDLGQAVARPVEPGREAPPSQKPTPTPMHPDVAAVLKELQEERGRRSGTDRRLDTEIAGLRQGLDEIRSMLGGKSVPVGQQPQQPSQAPATTPQEGQPTELDQLRDIILEERALRLEAEATVRARKIAAELTRPGQPGEGIDLDVWMDAVELHPVDEDPDGEKQKAEFTRIIERIKGVRKQATDDTAKAMMSGVTPGMSPGTPGRATQSDLIQEMRDLHAKVNSPDFSNLPREEQESLLTRYDQLGPAYGHHVSDEWTGWGWQSPQMNARMMQELMRQLEGQGVKLDLERLTQHGTEGVGRAGEPGPIFQVT